MTNICLDRPLESRDFHIKLFDFKSVTFCGTNLTLKNEIGSPRIG